MYGAFGRFGGAYGKEYHFKNNESGQTASSSGGTVTVSGVQAPPHWGPKRVDRYEKGLLLQEAGKTPNAAQLQDISDAAAYWAYIAKWNKVPPPPLGPADTSMGRPDESAGTGTGAGRTGVWGSKATTRSDSFVLSSGMQAAQTIYQTPYEQRPGGGGGAVARGQGAWDQGVGSSGLPTWAWVVGGIAVVGLLAYGGKKYFGRSHGTA